MTLQELIDRCEAEVSLVVNEHRTYYQTPQEWAEERLKNEWGMCEPIFADPLPYPMEGQTYNLQFYPHTPIGSYHIIGTSLESVLAKAFECLQ